MDGKFEQLIEVNIQGRVFAICKSRGVADPTLIGYYTDILRQAIYTELTEESAPAEFNRILDAQSDWLEREIDQNLPNLGVTAAATDAPGEASTSESADEEQPPVKRSSGYVPNAKSMPERLADQRSSIQQMLEQDCVILKLITPKQAKFFKRRLLGQEPKKAEQELVAELRGILHQQIREFIRKNDGGPWASATLQNELRMDIMAIHSMRSLVSMTKETLYERKDWLVRNKAGLASRLFGGKLGFRK